MSRKVTIKTTLRYDIIIVAISGRFAHFCPAENLPTVSKILNKAIINIAYQLPPFSTF